MSTEKMSLGKAIDILLEALEPLDEASRETAMLAVCRQLKISSGPAPKEAGSSDRPTEVDQSAPTSSSPQAPAKAALRVDIRSFKDEKKPNSVKQMACVVAYYLKELANAEEQKETVSSADLEKYFKQAGYKLPTRMPQVLIDAKASGYFESVGRGEYKLNAVGHNLVAHNLPGED
ncbi:hypothetical protein [Arenimonas sp. MALMAid1274]|uniref:hypothetical protein n=1 Tax=Arenimonas sp. MALMAid1274 TaxID=3411630 RepID=UPI003B9FAFF2